MRNEHVVKDKHKNIARNIKNVGIQSIEFTGQKRAFIITRHFTHLFQHFTKFPCKTELLICH